ncbi:MerR family transcriptional regulator [Frischella sp. Ac48]|uniref:MerR family transcriptional regulator n=1 Tax=Frischella japonica TaxID=2741544 RepID=A0ABR7QUZ2_9GAMM|nr:MULTISPECIES: MerR family transcriptional regulator [Frischella]MBC9130030.1 MerR family transcriptional regulator [Frischella japonica]MBX4133013.1 MerR family transcriptional regulator [Frischella sp. Ac48]
MKINELAKVVGCSTETIRFYEKTGLLFRPERGANNYRIYHKKHLERLLFIRNCRALEMSHDEIKTLITIMVNPNNQAEHDNAHQLLQAHLQHIDERIEELTNLRQQLMKLQNHCHSSNQSCGILQELTEMSVTVKSTKNHL